MNYAHEGARVERVKAPSQPVVLPQEDARLSGEMRQYLNSRALPNHLALYNGWYPAHYQQAPRIVIPATSLANTWPYFQARAMDNHPMRYASPKAPRGDALVVCYPPGTATHCVIVEGPMDALAAAGTGAVGVALMGNQPGPLVLAHIHSYVRCYSRVSIIPDVDAYVEAMSVAHRLWALGCGCQILPMTRYKDLAEMPPSERVDFLK